jgi:hypothetical protein
MPISATEYLNRAYNEQVRGLFGDRHPTRVLVSAGLFDAIQLEFRQVLRHRDALPPGPPTFRGMQMLVMNGNPEWEHLWSFGQVEHNEHRVQVAPQKEEEVFDVVFD